ncbi:MAG: ribonuclease HII [Eubacteriales bacterium]
MQNRTVYIGVSSLTPHPNDPITTTERSDFMIPWEEENLRYSETIQTICGVDEAGRGPLAGPVCAAAVILPRDCVIEGLDDSKKLSEKRRDTLYDIIIEQAQAYSIAMVDEKTIDEINILQATYVAMGDAVKGLKITPDLALVDGNRDPKLDILTETMVKGDGRSLNIAAASVLAKVTRDRYMVKLAEQYPEYGFEVHKGYGTKRHYAALDEHGDCSAHRQSFLKKYHAKG